MNTKNKKDNNVNIRIKRKLDSKIQFKIAESKEELFRAHNLVFQQYLESGYVVTRRTSLHFGLQDIYPGRKTIIISLSGIIFATATIIPDSFVGLPMDDLYEAELNKLRKKNSKMCEISMLACNDKLLKDKKFQLSYRRRKFLVYHLFKYIFEFVRDELKLDHILITINPSQNKTYQNLFFEDIGKIKPYYKLEGALALGKIVDLRTVEKKLSKIKKNAVHNIVFSSLIDSDLFNKTRKSILGDY